MKIKTYLLCILFIPAIFISCKSGQEKNTEESAITQNDTIILDDSSIAIINTSSTMANDEVLLRFNPSKGASYNMIMDMNYDMKTSAMGQEMNQKMGMSMTTNMQVSDIDAAGNSILTATYKNIKMNMDMAGMKMSYESGKNSDDEMSKMMGQIFDAFINVPLTITLDPSAKVTSATGFDAIQKKIEAKMGPEAGDMSEMNNMQESIQGSFAFLPNKNVKIGDTWQQQLNTTVQQYPMTMQSTYTLLDRKNGIATIAVRSNMTMDNTKMNKEEMTKMGVENMTMSGSSSGTMEVNEQTGWTSGAKLTQDIKMEVSAQGQKMPMSMKGSILMRTE